MITGVLSCLDGYMNIALEQTEEHVNGVVTNKYGDAFIRGNNGNLSIYPIVCGELTSKQYCIFLRQNPCNPCDGLLNSIKATFSRPRLDVSSDCYET